MPADPSQPLASDDALRPLVPGPLLRIGNDLLQVDIAAAAGGRIAQIWFAGIDWLIAHSEANAARIAWGCYPMLPWAGRIRDGRFSFGGQTVQLPLNLGAHAIHGVGFAMPWQVDHCSAGCAELSLVLPHDHRWPFGGHARQHIEVAGQRLRLALSVTAGTQPMPVTLGWHPWFRKPDRVGFEPACMYARDAAGIATSRLRDPVPGPWDDCFINNQPVLLQRGDQRVTLSSECRHWVVYDEPAHASCFEPQSGPPDGLNLEPQVLAPGESLGRWFELEWLAAAVPLNPRSGLAAGRGRPARPVRLR